MGCTIHVGDARTVLATLPAAFARCCVTSPPYWKQRDYGCAGQIGLELTPEAYVAELVAVFREVHRVLADDGSLWLNIGDTYAAGGNGGGGSVMKRRVGASWSALAPKKGWRGPPPGYKNKDLVGTSWMLAAALQAAGWYLRGCNVWDKTVATEPPRADRCATGHEFVFLLSKRPRYHCDATALPSSTVWRFRPVKSGLRHEATMPPKLARCCILAGSQSGDMILDPFAGGGTVGLEADRNGRHFCGIEINPAYAEEARERIRADAPLFA